MPPRHRRRLSFSFRLSISCSLYRRCTFHLHHRCSSSSPAHRRDGADQIPFSPFGRGRRLLLSLVDGHTKSSGGHHETIVLFGWQDEQHASDARGGPKRPPLPARAAAPDRRRSCAHCPALSTTTPHQPAVRQYSPVPQGFWHELETHTVKEGHL